MPKQKSMLPHFMHFTGLRTRPWINLDLVWRIERLPENAPAHPRETGYALFFLAAGEAPLKITDKTDVMDLARLLGDDLKHHF